MKKGELIALNAAFGKLTLPDVRMDDLYPILSAKADIGKEAELIEEKAATFQRETKPEGAGDFEISLADPVNREWWNKSQAMRMRLYEEEAETMARLTVVEGAASFGSTRAGSKAVALKAGMSAVLGNDDSTPRMDSRTDVNTTVWATHQFHFDDTPLPEVLSTLSRYYHVRLTASDTGKRLTADFDADSLDNIISLVSQTLNVNISKEK